MQSATKGTPHTTVQTMQTMQTVQTVDVAIGVIHFGPHYLLGFRHAKQHQGNCYEFIGGKVEPHETPRQALAREMAEEIGLVIQQDNNTRVNRLGVLQHHYVSVSQHAANAGHKQAATTQQSTSVCLHVYRVTLSEAQYQHLSTLTQGCEQQPLKWVTQSDLVANRYVLPAANVTILEWLTLADIITVTYELTATVITTCFAQTSLTETSLAQTSRAETAKAKQNSDLDKTQDRLQNHTENNRQDNRQDNRQNNRQNNRQDVKKNNEQDENNPYEVRQNIADWLEFQRLYLPHRACVYVRLKTLALRHEVQAIMQLIEHRPDLSLIISAAAAMALSQGLLMAQDDGLIRKRSTCHPLNSGKPNPLPHQIIAQHLTQANLDMLDTLHTMDTQDAQGLLSLPWHPTLPITLSCHDESSIQKANKLAKVRINSKQPPVIALFLSPVMPTISHPDATPLGWHHFNKLANLSHIPVIALGGLTPDSLITARQHGADKIAGIRQFYKLTSE